MRAPRALLAVMSAWFGAYVVVLAALPHTVTPWIRDIVLGQPPLIFAGLALLSCAVHRPDTRRWTVPLACAVGLYLVGNVGFYAEITWGDRSFPSWGDVGYLGVYPFLLAGLLLAMRDQLRGVRLIVALDGLGGTLAGGALASWVVAPLIERIWNGTLGAAVTIAYPLCAVVLVSATLGAIGMTGRRMGRRFLVWGLGLLVYGVGDVLYAFRINLHLYAPGTLLDATWAGGLALVAFGATAGGVSEHRSVPSTRSLFVVTLSCMASVAVLAAAPGWSVTPLPTLLALATLTVCGVRLVLAFIQLRELAAIRAMALTDELTGIANRRALYTALDEMFVDRAVGGRKVPREFALALIDLDHFKEVNDSYGHAAGDELLQAVVQRFSGALQDLQTPHLLARLGGDEFAVILHDASSHNAAMACGSALQESLAEPVVLRDVVLHAQASIGLASAPLHARNRGDMLFAADAAMYASKTSGEPVCFHSPASVGDRRRRLSVAEDLYDALERDELTVEFQPILTAQGELAAAEALVRWDHPTRGRLSPIDFLDTAERYKLTPAIADRVLDVALGQLAGWRARGSSVTMSVNVSASDLRDEGLVKSVASALLAHAVPPEALTVEITETAMMHNPDLAQQVMKALADLGVRLAVDDYGTGYSSLEYLLKLPISEIKLDRAFCANIVTELRATAIVRSTVDLTHALGLHMVAEGVEDAGTLFVLQELGCDLVQGWHLGRPMPAEAFQRLVDLQLARPTGGLLDPALSRVLDVDPTARD